MKIFIVEDEELHLETAIMYVEKSGHTVCGSCDNADKAFDEIKTALPDVVLVDIALPGLLNGIGLAQKINRDLSIPHIFTTSFSDDEVIKDAIDTNPKAYLKKPIDMVNLKAAIEIAIQPIKTNNEEIDSPNPITSLLFTKIGDRLVKIPVKNIKFIKADGDNYSSIFFNNKEVACRKTIKELLKQLPSNFIQIHRSTVININFLSEIKECDQVAIVQNKELPIGRKYKKEFLALLHRI